ncbi:hypothetical protein [Brevundimonas sp.]|uniref:hypothetical protein n=1 Tax=Brevundimonas sp. TaxID=1871086 RepID=UPI002D4A3C96|nr:hypothetical protein [Brevundimonas sp.]HYC97328.1 hypothetical protein [Brevundimonas sp.]
MRTSAAAFFMIASLGCAGASVARDAPVAAPADWGQALREDAQAFHDAIAASHPGPVDVENPGFGALLEGGLRTALTRPKRRTATPTGISPCRSMPRRSTTGI